MHFIRKQLEQLLIQDSIETTEDIEMDTLINLGNRISNIYMIQLSEGYLLIDTGYEEQYAHFIQKLSENQIDIRDISYVLLTHAHDDHAGFLNQVLKHSDAKVIMHEEACERLSVGQNSFEGGCTSLLSLLVCKIMKLLGKGEHRFKPVNQKDRYILLNKETQSEIEEKITGKIICLPGHTPDSIGLLFEDGSLFCGDAAMNGFPSHNNIIIWIEDLNAYMASWKYMMELDATMIFPAHGKPFEKNKLIKNSSRLNKIKLRPLK